MSSKSLIPSRFWFFSCIMFHVTFLIPTAWGLTKNYLFIFFIFSWSSTSTVFPDDRTVHLPWSSTSALQIFRIRLHPASISWNLGLVSGVTSIPSFDHTTWIFSLVTSTARKASYKEFLFFQIDFRANLSCYNKTNHLLCNINYFKL